MIKKYKIKITKIYIFEKQIKICYNIYVKNNKKSKYTLYMQGAGLSVKDFLIYWFNYIILKESIIQF